MYPIRCKFEKCWQGQCENMLPCEDHDHRVCISCGAPATHDCESTLGPFVCGADLCDDCEHTYNEEGCHSMQPPEGMKDHVRKTDQKYKPYYMQEDMA